MSQITQYQDDFSGEIVTADSIYPDFRISIGTEKYTLDATPATVAAIRIALLPFTEKARMMPGSKPIRPLGEADEIPPPIPPTPASTNGNGHQAANDEIRAWAKQRGIKVNERGRLPVNVTAEYAATHP